MITIDANAPPWAHMMAAQIQQAIDRLDTPQLQVFTTTTLPDPTDPYWLWRPFVVSDGAADKWVAISNGTEFRYFEGTAL